MNRSAKFREFQQLRYGQDSPAQVLDIYSPGGSAPAPLVVAIHGGAFMVGDRTWELDAVDALIDHGFAVASLEYRLSGEAVFPAAVLDVKQAVAHLRRHADDLRLDPRFVAAWGRSAGGHLAAMLGVTSGPPDEFERPGDDSHVDAVVDWYGPSDFLQMDAQFRAGPPTGEGAEPQVHDPADSPESRWLGAAIQSVPEIAARANPVSYLDDGHVPPPFFLACGTNDRLVPHQQTLVLADALRRAGGEVELRVLEHAAHADRRFEDELTDPAVDWLTGLARLATAAGTPNHEEDLA